MLTTNSYLPICEFWNMLLQSSMSSLVNCIAALSGLNQPGTLKLNNRVVIIKSDHRPEIPILNWQLSCEQNNNRNYSCSFSVLFLLSLATNWLLIVNYYWAWFRELQGPELTQPRPAIINYDTICNLERRNKNIYIAGQANRPVQSS